MDIRFSISLSLSLSPFPSFSHFFSKKKSNIIWQLKIFIQLKKKNSFLISSHFTSNNFLLHQKKREKDFKTEIFSFLINEKHSGRMEKNEKLQIYHCVFFCTKNFKNILENITEKKEMNLWSMLTDNWIN